MDGPARPGTCGGGSPATIRPSRGVPEVFNSTYDVRTLLDAAHRLRDGKPLGLPGPEALRKHLLARLDSTETSQLLTESGLLPDAP